MTPSDRKRAYAAPAVEKAFEVIGALAEFPEGALVSELAGRLGRSVGELFRIVIVMEQLGYLRKHPVSERYLVTYRLLEAALRASPGQDLVSAALAPMQALARGAGQSCHLVVANEGHGLVLAREQQPGVRGFSLRVGARIDLVRSCSGCVILAYLSDAERERQLRDAEAEADRPLDRDALEPRLASIRRQGFDRRASAVVHGVTDVSFPVVGFDGAVAAALTIPFLEHIDGSQKVDLEAAGTLLREAARQVSTALGGSPPPANLAP